MCSWKRIAWLKINRKGRLSKSTTHAQNITTPYMYRKNVYQVFDAAVFVQMIFDITREFFLVFLIQFVLWVDGFCIPKTLSDAVNQNVYKQNILLIKVQCIWSETLITNPMHRTIFFFFKQLEQHCKVVAVIRFHCLYMYPFQDHQNISEKKCFHIKKILKPTEKLMLSSQKRQVFITYVSVCLHQSSRHWKHKSFLWQSRFI